MFESLLSLDRSIFLRAIELVPSEYAKLLYLLGESVVIWVALMLIGLWLYGVKREDNRYKVISLSIFATVIMTFVIYSIINIWLPQWRIGAMELSGATALIPHPTDNSFPSGHALFTGAVLMALIRFLPWKTLIACVVIFGIVTAVARVLGGVHYPGDIIGGWIFGIISGLVFGFLVDTRFFREYIFAPVVALARFFKL